MIQLHDTTRRRVCIACFLLLGALPPLLVSGWCLSRRAPWRAQEEAQELSRRLGLEIKLGGLRHTRPGTMLYERLEASDAETGQTLFRCRLLEIIRGRQSDQQGQARTVLSMIASQPEVEAAAVDRIWQCLQRILEGVGGPLEADVRLSVDGLTLRAGEYSQTLAQTSGTLEKLPGGLHARLDFRLAGVKTSETAHIRVVRNRQASPPASGFELDTGGGELPCNVLAVGLEQLKSLGPRCRFRGSIWANQTPDGWQGEISGRFIELDLGNLVSDNFPHKLTGSGEVTVESARFSRGRLLEGSATVLAGPGVIGRSLLAAAVDWLGLAAPAMPLPDGEFVPYQQLAFLATLDTNGLRLQGICKDAELNTILSDGRRRLLGDPQGLTTAVALVRTLVPQNAVYVPATRQTDWLLRHLPLPEAAPSVTSPRVHARLRENTQR